MYFNEAWNARGSAGRGLEPVQSLGLGVLGFPFKGSIGVWGVRVPLKP